jgi:hypothetical protein
MPNNLVALALAVLFYYTLMHSTVLDKEYHRALVHLYTYPLFRFALLGLLLWAFSWSNTIGIALGLVVVFYYADVGFFTTPSVSVSEKQSSPLM